MTLSRITVLCLSIGAACQFSACSKSDNVDNKSKANGTTLISGGVACSKIVEINNRYPEFDIKNRAAVLADTSALVRVKSMLSEMEKVTADFDDFNCVIKLANGKIFSASREKLVKNIADIRADLEL